MTIREAQREAMEALRRAGKPDAALDARYLLMHALSMDATALLLHGGAEIPEDALAHLRALLRRRAGGEPLSYILGEQPFMGLPFYVDPRVLIPRPETELLAQEAIRMAGEIPDCRVLEIGVGSGAIAVSVAKFTDARVTAVDISKDALSVAARNAQRHGVALELIEGDAFAAIPADCRFALILSNPPYVRAEEIPGLMAEVRREPVLALDGGADGLDFYRLFAAQAASHLNPGGALILEMGAGQMDDVCALFAGWALTRITDYAGIERVLIARLPDEWRNDYE